MDIFSMLCLVDTVVSVTNGFISLYNNINKKSGKQTNDEIFTHTDGRRYEGTLINGEAQGKGVIIYPDGTRCEGEFSHGELNGIVRITWTDGRVYVGEWRNKQLAPQQIPQEIVLPHPFTQTSVTLLRHPALSSQEPFLLEYFGDVSTTLFDRWFCYQQAFQVASTHHIVNTDRLLNKLATIEAESTFPTSLFESVVSNYTQAMTFCQAFPSPETVTIEQLFAYRDALKDAQETLRAYSQPETFLLALAQYFNDIIRQLILHRPVLRRQYVSFVAESQEFMTDRLRLQWEGTPHHFLILSKARVTIGRSDQPGQPSDLFVMDVKDPAHKTYISRFHAILEITPHAVYVLPDRNRYDIWIERGTHIIPVRQTISVEHGDLIRLGKQATGQGVALRYAAFYAETSAQPEMIVDKNVTLADTDHSRSLLAAKITVEQGMTPYRTVIMCRSACSIGRDATHPLQLDDQRVSRNQAVLVHQQGGFWVADTGSRNGTWLNEVACSELTPIVPGDAIRFGNMVTLKIHKHERA